VRGGSGEGGVHRQGGDVSSDRQALGEGGMGSLLDQGIGPLDEGAHLWRTQQTTHFWALCGIIDNVLIDDVLIDNVFIDDVLIDNVFIDDVLIDNVLIDNVLIDDVLIDDVL